MELSENININKYAMKLIEDKQPSYKSIYSLGLLKLEILKAYIKTYLKTGLIWLSKSSIGASIIFDQKPNNSLYFRINY